MGTISSRLQIKTPQSPLTPQKKRTFEGEPLLKNMLPRKPQRDRKECGTLPCWACRRSVSRCSPRAGAVRWDWICGYQSACVNREPPRRLFQQNGSGLALQSILGPELVLVWVLASTSACSQEKQILCQKSNFWFTFPFPPLSWDRSRRYKARGFSSMAVACLGVWVGRHVCVQDETLSLLSGAFAVTFGRRSFKASAEWPQRWGGQRAGLDLLL